MGDRPFGRDNSPIPDQAWPQSGGYTLAGIESKRQTRPESAGFSLFRDGQEGQGPLVRILIAIGVPRQREAGAAGVVINHKRELERRGHTVECWFLEDVFERPPRFGRFEALIFGMGVAKRVLRERDRFDVVNIHAPWACVYGVWRKLLHPTGAPPYVMTMQGCDEHWVHIMRREHRKGRAWHFGWKNRLWHHVYERPMYHYSIRTADYGVVANREGWIFSELACDRDPGRIRFVP